LTSQDPLAALHPLREPAMVGWWPPAPGWWILSSVILLGLAFAFVLLWRRHRRNRYRRLAQNQLLAIRAQYQQDGDARRCLIAVNALLKSVALKAYPPRQVAPASGDSWLAVINRELPPEHQLKPPYFTALYSARQDDLQIEEVLTAASIWIRRHKGLPA
jgi:hypothetical protein